MPENASITEPLPGPVSVCFPDTRVRSIRIANTKQATIQEEISLHSVSVYEKPGVAAQSLGYLIKPVSHGPGRLHLISTHILALLLNYPPETLKQWAAAGDCFIKLVWTFPGWERPQFTTRHLLVTDTALGHVSFYDGLGWAENMWKAVNPPQPQTYPYFSGHQNLKPHWDRAIFPPKGGGSKPSVPLPVPFTNLDAQWKAQYQTVTYPSRGTVEDLVAELSLEDAPSLTDAASEDSKTVFSSEPAEMEAEMGAEMGAEMAAAEDPNPGKAPYSHHKTGDKDGSQSRLDMLRRQKREAEALYARNGDPSGLLALLLTASQSADNWDAHGIPRF